VFLTVGQPLPWDAYDQSGTLLLRRGEAVPSEKAIEMGARVVSLADRYCAMVSTRGYQASHRKTHLADFAMEDVLTVDKLSIPIRLASIWGKDAKLS